MPFGLLLSLCLSCQAPQEAEPRAFLLKTQETLEGNVLRLEGDTVVLRVEFIGGGATVRRSLADFAPASRFAILLQASPPKTFDEHLQMAVRAVELGLLPQAGLQAASARRMAEVDATGAQRQRLDAWVATTLRALFDRAIAEQALVDARHWFRLVVTRVPDSVDGDEIGRMFDILATAEAKGRAPVVAGAAEPSPAMLSAARLLKPVAKHLLLGDQAVADGLHNARRTVQATRAYTLALSHYKSAATELQQLLAAHGEDATVQAEAAPLVQRVKDSAMEAALHAGHALVVQGDYRSAYEWASKALAMEPGNAEARSLRNTIEMAQAAGGAWGLWGRSIGQ